MASTPLLHSKKFNLVSSSDDLKKPGDFYVVKNLESAGEKSKAHPAIIFKCPYCGMEMASTAIHKIEYSKSLWDLLCGYEGKINISTMLQCRYANTHKFTIRRNRVITLN